jgi:hypothetical protein
MIKEKRELIEQLSELLIKKESINVLDIKAVLGDRPFGQTDEMSKILEQVEKRAQDRVDKEEKEKAEKINKEKEVLEEKGE